MLWASFLQKTLKIGHLTVIDAMGKVHHCGITASAPTVTIKLHDRALHYQLLLNPDFYLGEAYMEGTLTIEEGTLHDLLTLFALNIDYMTIIPLEKLTEWLGPGLRRLQQYNTPSRSKAVIDAHYDLSETFYTLFLDPDLQYSCAYFTQPTDDLETAQYHKKRHIAAKLLIEPGMQVLDVGCGWGGLALYLARTTGAAIIGINLSAEQCQKATRRAGEAGLENQVRFQHSDYREATGTYDRIVSIGLLEHIGVNYYKVFFNKIKTLLKPDGIALVHCIGRMDGPGTTNPWLRKYIFPGGYAPALSEVLPIIEKSGLWVTDIEILRLHYVETLKGWYARFQANRERIAQLYDERFCRMWEFYLVGAEMDFKYLSTMIFQIQLAKDIAAVPLTRDYMFKWEQTHP
jgi:cyclopropane-fatty-acyl-phospholipid synthase